MLFRESVTPALVTRFVALLTEVVFWQIRLFQEMDANRAPSDSMGPFASDSTNKSTDVSTFVEFSLKNFIGMVTVMTVFRLIAPGPLTSPFLIALSIPGRLK